MAQDIVKENQKISYTNLDFSSIYTEVLDLIKQLSFRWDPSIADESDPGVILVKLSALIADKCNYNIDKSVLEAFPLSVTQEGNARQLYEQLGYYMNWYKAASVPVSINWVGQNAVDTSIVYNIPKFTAITDNIGDKSSIVYSLVGVEGVDGTVVSDIPVGTNGETTVAIAMEGVAVQYECVGEKVITPQMVDANTHRLYFNSSNIAENGIFIKNTAQENYSSWHRVNNIYEQSYDELRYMFGYDSQADLCYLEFPDNYDELFGSGIEITYLLLTSNYSDIPAQTLTQFVSSISIESGEENIVLDSSNIAISNYRASYGHAEKENIDDAYVNYKRTVGTFNTLITLRDYLNFIKDRELDICSNAFVCDRTNDIQSVYKIMNKNHDLDTILTKVEHIIDKTSFEADFEYKFVKSTDDYVVEGKQYYEITGGIMTPVTVGEIGVVPKYAGFYELESRTPKDVLEAFSLKFYLLNKAISLDTKTAYDETFNLSYETPNFDTLLEDSSHLEHTYENILPLGDNLYKLTADEEFKLNEKAYYKYDNLYDKYNLVTSTDGYSGNPKEAGLYEVDIEALMPHIAMFKNIYPLTVSISTYNNLDNETQADITRNIIRALYQDTNSAELEFGEAISVEYLSNIVKNSDDRIKSVTFDNIEYITKAVYYDKYDKIFKEVTINTDASILSPESYTSQLDILNAAFKKDILAKSILAGVTQLLIPNEEFEYHLNQKFLDHIENVLRISSEATIDISSDVTTTYSASYDNPFVKKSYTLKDNEILTLFQPTLSNVVEFLNGVHYEYILYNPIIANQSRPLKAGEYVIFYTPELDDTGLVRGYTASIFSNGNIIKSTFDFKAQPDEAAVSNYARLRLIPNIKINEYDTSTLRDNKYDNRYEETVYTESYKNEIRNNPAIAANAIMGNDSVAIQVLEEVTIDRKDNYKFFWVLNNPVYPEDTKIKSYVLFDSYDSTVDDNSKNTYTLKSGEYLYYTDAKGTNLAILFPGTQITRNCGVLDNVIENVPVENSIYYMSQYDIEHGSEEHLDITIKFLTTAEGIVSPKLNGAYKVITNPDEAKYIGEKVGNPRLKNLYERISLSETSGQLASDDIYRLTTKDKFDDETIFYDPKLLFEKYNSDKIDSGMMYIMLMHKTEGFYIRTQSEDGDKYTLDSLDSHTVFYENNVYSLNSQGGYDMISPSDYGLYEMIANDNGTPITDFYSLNIDMTSSKPQILSPTVQNRYSLTTDTTLVTRRFIPGIYNNLDLSSISSYTEIDTSRLDSFSPYQMGLMVPTYKKYYEYVDNEYKEVTDIDYLTNPKAKHYYEFSGELLIETEDTIAEILSVKPSSSSDIPFVRIEDASTTYSDDTSATNYVGKGYFYKDRPTSTVFQYKANNTGDSSRLTFDIPITSGVKGLDISLSSELLQVYNKEATRHPTDLDMKIIDNAWKTDKNYTYCLPSEWALKNFAKSEVWTEWPEAGSADYNGKFIVVDTDTLAKRKSSSGSPISLGDIYPNAWEAYEGSISISYYFVQAVYGKDLLGENIPSTGIQTYTKAPGFTKLKDVIEGDDGLKVLQRVYPNGSDAFIISTTNTYIVMYYLPVVYKFMDLCKLTYKKYYSLKDYYTRAFGKINAWSCTAIDNDDIENDPIKTIGDLWEGIQYNTSITITRNSIESFGAGDIISFTSKSSSEYSTDWPKFNNDVIALDTNQYSISYQRVGDKVVELPTIDIEGHNWHGYSSLLLNTSGENGQKLSYNHKLSLYDSADDSSDSHKITDIPNNFYTDKEPSIQLKYPIANKSGTFIDVSSTNTLGNALSNSIYVYKNLSNGNDYAYATDNATYLYFNRDERVKSIDLPIGLDAGNYLLPIRCVDGIDLTANFKPIFKNNSINSIPVEISTAKQGLKFEAQEVDSFLGSYAHPEQTVFNGDRYYYLYLGLDAYNKITLPSIITNELNQSPSELGWYELDNGKYKVSENSDMGKDLIEEVPQAEIEKHNPLEMHWYVKEGDVYRLYAEGDTGTLYREKEFYAGATKLDSTITFSINIPVEFMEPVTYIIDDIFKFTNNKLFGNSFDILKDKLVKLDVDDEYNYAYIPNENDLIQNPLEAKTFWNTNHIFNKFTIAQLDFDSLECKYLNTKKNR